MTHKDLEVWKLSIGFVTSIYKVCKQLPDSEKFGLITQIQRAAVSIPTNIAEGAARKNTKEYIQFLHIALGSCSEVDTLIQIIKNIYSIDMVSLEDTNTQISKMLVGLIKSLKSKLV
ncbi:MAG: four helix bundle protein [Chitinophagaceae bacterium]